jgi:hypothetical protein
MGLPACDRSETEQHATRRCAEAASMTCATLLLLVDVPAKIVSGRLGHGGITITLDPHSHVQPTMQKRAADTLAKLLGGWEQG